MVSRIKGKSVLTVKHAVHQYRRVRQGTGRYIYRCVITGCNHFVTTELLVGRVAVCNRCHKEFEITQATIFPRLKVKPHCSDCDRPVFNKATGRVQKGKAHEDKTLVANRFIDDILKGI